MRKNSLWALIKLNFKVSFGLAAMRYYLKRRDKKFMTGLGIFALVIAGFLPLFFLYMRLVDAVYEATAPLGQEQVVLTMAAVMASVLVFFMGIVYVVSAFYFSNDLPFLMSLPLPFSHIFGGKFAVVLVEEYLTVAPFFLSALWIYGTRSAPGSLFWLIAVLSFLLLPVIPLAAASLAVLVLMSATGLSRRKDTLRLLSMFFIILVVVVLNYYLARIPEGSELVYVQSLLQDPEGLAAYIARIYPPALWVTRSLASAGAAALFNFLMTALSSVLAVVLVLAAARRLFFRGWAGGQEAPVSRRLDSRELERHLGRVSSPRWAIALRELKILIRTPVYLFNSLATLVIVPVILVVPLLSGGELSLLIEELNRPGLGGVLNLAGAGFIAIMSIFSAALSSSISREGKMFWLSKVIPLNPLQQLQGKLLAGYLLAALAVPLVLLFSAVIPWKALDMIIIALLGLVACFPVLTSNLFVDLLRPYLDWDNPQKAIKQNINTLLGMLLSAAVLLPSILVAFWGLRCSWSLHLIYFLIAGISLFIGGIFYYLIARLAQTRYAKINV